MYDESQISIASRLAIQRRFLKVGDRRVHYVRAGNGPPAVLIHASPANAWEMLPAIEQLAPQFTCFAFDTPGFGLSDPLTTSELTLADLADSLAECMRLIGLPPCPIYGRHTGAAIALELAVGHPARVTGVVLDGLSAFTAEECASIFEGYFPPMPVDELGGHFARTWTRFRDHLIWFPWFMRQPGNLNGYDLDPPARIQNLVMMYFYAAKTYLPVYRAALSHGQRALTAVSALGRPAVIMALETDMLYPHLARLPPLKTGQEIRAIGQSIDLKHKLVAESFARFGSAGSAPPGGGEIGTSPTVEYQFVDIACGQFRRQLHVRFAGDRSAPPLLLLHDAPGSARFLEPLVTLLSSHYFVCAPDLPGCGESPPLPGGTREMADFAAAVVEMCRGMGLDRPLVYGIGFGSSVAIALATAWPAAVSGLVLRGVLLPDPGQRDDLRRHYAPEIALEKDGSHWYRTWLMLRDSLIYWPWYDQRFQSLRRVSGDFGAARLHAWTFDVMKQPECYGHVIQAACNFDAGAALAAIDAPVLFCVDPATPLSACDSRLQTMFPAIARFKARDDGADVQSIRGHFRG